MELTDQAHFISVIMMTEVKMSHGEPQPKLLLFPCPEKICF